MLNLIILLFVILIMVSTLFIIISKQPVLNILFLILTYILVIFLYLILGLEFLALITCIVYVGAITILFLFTVMLLNLKIVELNESFLKYIPVGTFIGLVFFF
jgi:NADH-quinone oxidoreductase subunit J